MRPVLLLALGLSILPRQGIAQTRHAPPLSPDSAFASAVRAATDRYHDVAAAVRDGFRPIGPDAPAMGRHWVNIGRVLDGRFDPARPAILTYTEIDGRQTLVGVAFGLPLDPDETPPGPFPARAWHVHAGDVTDEGALFGHAMAPVHTASARGVGLLHIWAWAANPDGLTAADNWALPWIRLRVEPPGPSPHLRAASLALSLPAGGAPFLSTVLARHHLTDAADRAHADRILAVHADRVAGLLADGVPPVEVLAAAWEACWTEVLEGLSDTGREAVRQLSAEPSH